MIRSIVWFRNDLRLHDNEALTQALETSEEIIPVYIFDERLFNGETRYGFPKLGKFRAKFIYDSIKDLSESIYSKGGFLITELGQPEELLFNLCRKYNARWVYCNRERTQEEITVQDALEVKLWSIGAEMRYCRGKMLYHTADLPFPITHTPDYFTQYRKEVEKLVPVRKPLPTPTTIRTPELVDPIKMTSKEELGIEDFIIKKGLNLVGGEQAALKELNYYLFESKLVSKYKETRNELLGRDFSSKFSAFLSKGCLSAKLIMSSLQEYETEFGANESTYWLFFELLWRDYFRLIAKKYGNLIFRKEGLKIRSKTKTESSEDWALFTIWKEGRTGIPFIDANMKELNETGFMSNRGRQNVASFLIHELGLNWQMGAEYFESQLIDYDPCSNYGNWNYLAGVGTDPKGDRHFNITYQSQKYDPNSEYIKFWLPELQNLPVDKIHDMSNFLEQDELDYCLRIGKDYPKACVRL